MEMTALSTCKVENERKKETNEKKSDRLLSGFHVADQFKERFQPAKLILHKPNHHRDGIYNFPYNALVENNRKSPPIRY